MTWSTEHESVEGIPTVAGKKNNSRIVQVEFRNKKDFGWRAHMETLYFSDGQSISSRVFTNLFFDHCILRPSCHRCPYKSVTHPGDITIADYWGIEQAAPEFDDDKGVSLVLVNNERGDRIFASVKKDIKRKATLLENSIQPPLKAPFPEPENRQQFWSDFAARNFTYVAERRGAPSWVIGRFWFPDNASGAR